MDWVTGAIAAGIFVFAAVVVLFLALFMMKRILHFAAALIVNSIVGLIALVALKLIGVSIPLTLPVLLSIAVFGLGGLGTILILVFSGVRVG